MYEPTVPRVPDFASATTTASGKLMPRSGSSASNTRRSANTSRPAGTSSFSATAAATSSRARSAASSAALPTISVTREE